VTGEEAVDPDPEPAAFTALTRNRYAVPFARPVTVYIAKSDPVSMVAVTQDDPEFDEYSTL
jgi:hypothetical protein